LKLRRALRTYHAERFIFRKPAGSKVRHQRAFNWRPCSVSSTLQVLLVWRLCSVSDRIEEALKTRGTAKVLGVATLLETDVGPKRRHFALE
jgi:hypothetical protein